MVLEGLRYGSNPLLEMRIHDLALLTDLSRPDPNHPDDPPPGGDPENGMEFDGTSSPSKTITAEADFNLMSLMPEIITSWTGPWPLFHIEISKDVPHTEGTLHIIAHTAKNLLGIAEQSNFAATGDGSIGDWPISAVQYALESAFPVVCVTTLKLSVGYLEFVLRNPAATANPVLVTVAAGAAAAAAVFAYMLPVIFANWMIDNHRFTHNEAGWFLLEVGVVFLGAAIGFNIFQSILAKITGSAPQQFLSGAQGKLASLAEYLKYSLFANIIIGVIGIGLIANAIIHWSQAT
ncbi:MAG: hypothetical protein EAX95_10060 [Candidatus Thorarchaeota archaeon]|nr:hypothetical protein [Candidatus Thorarchaeota archaeon]